MGFLIPSSFHSLRIYGILAEIYLPLPRFFPAALSLICCLLCLTWQSSAQSLDYDSVLAKATLHRQNQLMAHTILWGYYHNVRTDTGYLDQQHQTFTRLREDGMIIEYDVQVIGTYYYKDSTFVLATDDPAIDPRLTRALSKLQELTRNNHWKTGTTGNVIARQTEINDLSTLAMYFDGANGMEYYSSLGTSTSRPYSLHYLFYNLRIRHNKQQLPQVRLDAKTHYVLVPDSALIHFARAYINEYNDNEAKYMALSAQNKDDQRFSDTMFRNRRLIARKYWDTTSRVFRYHDVNGPQVDGYKRATHWRVITIDGSDRYVLFQHPSTGYIHMLALKMKTVGRRLAIEAIYWNFN